MRCAFRAMGLTVIVTMVAGCLSYRPGELSEVAPTSTMKRAGTVYLVRGLYGVFSTGLDTLQARLERKGVRALIFDDAQADDLAETLVARYRDVPEAEPIVLVGHSLGADDTIAIARRLDEVGLEVALLILLDPVYPDPVPPNVARAINFYYSTGDIDLVPIFRGVPVTAGKNMRSLTNIDIRYDRPDLMETETNHFNIEKNEKVQRQVIDRILTACPPRRQWIATRSALVDGPHAPVPSSRAESSRRRVRDTLAGD